MHITNTMVEITIRVKHSYKYKRICAGRENSKEGNEQHETSGMIGRVLKASGEIITQNDAENTTSFNRQQQNP